MIEVTGLAKFYGGKPAIRDISFRIDQGEIVGLLGLNGAGKSTILKILGCFLLPSAGRAVIGGYSTEDNAHAIRSLIGYLPDVPPLYAEMSVAQFLRYVALLKDVKRSEVDQCVADAIAQTNLQMVTEQMIGGLSHGFRQRVGIAQAIVHRPKVLILDEPINGLDPVQIVEMRDLIVSLRKKHTVVLSSHILSEITRTCDRILIVDHGKLVAEGNESTLQRNAQVSLRVRCEIAGAFDAQNVRWPAGVTLLSRKPITEQHALVELEMEKDERAAIARAIVESGAGLLSLQRHSDGLEELFMKFVRSGHE